MNQETTPAPVASAEVPRRVPPHSDMAVMLRVVGVLQILLGFVLAMVLLTYEPYLNPAYHLNYKFETAWIPPFLRICGWALLIGNFLSGVFWFAVASVVDHLHAIRFHLQSRSS